jgi:lysophospholipase L1-like esterase
MKKKSIFTYGSSVALYVRPPRYSRDGGNFSELIATMSPNCSVTNLGLPSGELRDLLLDFDSFVTRNSPDVIIFNYGINEICPRTLPRSVFKFIHGQCYVDGPVKKNLKAIANILWNRKFGPLFLKIKGSSGWCSPKLFHTHCETFSKLIQKETHSNVIALTVPKTSLRIQKLLPGIIDRIHGFNQVIRHVFSQCNNNKHRIIDLEKEWDGREDILVPDGIHFSQEGHIEVAKSVSKVLSTES